MGHTVVGYKNQLILYGGIEKFNEEKSSEI